MFDENVATNIRFLGDWLKMPSNVTPTAFSLIV
jgi:hypothetical protein